MTKLFEPDPEGMGLPALLNCVRCARDRYSECVNSAEADVLVGPGVVEIRGVPCTCGEVLIKLDWLVGDARGDDDH